MSVLNTCNKSFLYLIYNINRYYPIHGYLSHVEENKYSTSSPAAVNTFKKKAFMSNSIEVHT